MIESQTKREELTRAEVSDQLRALGVHRGGILLVHTSFRATRPVEGGPLGLIEALRDALGPEGTCSPHRLASVSIPWPAETRPAIVGSTVQALSLPPLGVALALMSVVLLRTRLFRVGAAVLLFPLSLIALAPWQPIHSYPGVLFGLGWVIFGVLYARRGSAVTSESHKDRSSLPQRR